MAAPTERPDEGGEQRRREDEAAAEHRAGAPVHALSLAADVNAKTPSVGKAQGRAHRPPERAQDIVSRQGRLQP